MLTFGTPVVQHEQLVVPVQGEYVVLCHMRLALRDDPTGQAMFLADIYLEGHPEHHTLTYQRPS